MALDKASNIFCSSKLSLVEKTTLEILLRFLKGNLSIADIAIAAQLSLLKFPKSSGPILSGEGCQEYINNPYLENIFIWRNNIEEYLFSANSQ